MKQHIEKSNILIDAIISPSSLWIDMALIAGFAVITALFSQISIWIGLIPITGQTFAVLLSGAVLGSRRGALAQLSYIAIGSTGIPFWFAAGGVPGIARIAGPTGGYLIGFIAVAFITGWLCEKGMDRKVWTAIPAMLCGNACLYLFGLPWLACFTGYQSVLAVGLYPFIIGDIIKILLAATAMPMAWSLIRLRTE